MKILVVGAGLVGAVQALILARSGHQVTVIEQRSLATAGNSSSAAIDILNSRTIALSHRSWQLLSNADLWPEGIGCGIGTVHVSEQGKFGSIRITAEKLGVDALGYVVRNTEYERYLHKQLQAEPGIKIIESAKLESLRQADNKVTVALTDDAIEADLLIASDGTGSVVRQMLDIGFDEYDYQQCAVLTNVVAHEKHQHRAYERFTRGGPLALLPLKGEGADNAYSMIFTAPEQDLCDLHKMSDQEMLQVLQKKFGGKLGRFEKIGKRFIVPLKKTVSKRQVQNHCVLVGNAARTLHPVAGQGLNLALRDVFELQSCLRSLDNSGNNVDKALALFLECRRRDQTAITHQTDLLARLFTEKPWPLRLPVSLATRSSFLLLDFLEPVKNRYAAFNMGQHVPLPK